jgi:hypothetical protein
MNEGHRRGDCLAAGPLGGGPPFGRIVVTGYYDGPTEGVVECAACGMCFAFVLLDWDEQQDLRIFSLAPLPERFDVLMQRAGLQATQDRTVLIGTSYLESAGTLRKLLQSAAAPTLAIATRNMLDGVIKSMPFPSRAVPDWFVELSLDREQ